MADSHSTAERQPFFSAQDLPLLGFVRDRDERAARAGVRLERYARYDCDSEPALCSDYYGTPEQLTAAGLVPVSDPAQFRWPRGRNGSYAKVFPCRHRSYSESVVRRTPRGRLFVVQVREAVAHNLTRLGEGIERYEVMCPSCWWPPALRDDASPYQVRFISHYGPADAIVRAGLLTQKGLDADERLHGEWNEADEGREWKRGLGGLVLCRQDLLRLAEEREAHKRKDDAETQGLRAIYEGCEHEYADPELYREKILGNVDRFVGCVLSLASGQHESRLSGEPPHLWFDSDSYRRLEELEAAMYGVVKAARICAPRKGPALRLVIGGDFTAAAGK